MTKIISEEKLIEALRQKIKVSPQIVKGIGDDCAVLPYDSENYLLLSTDTLEENTHFLLNFIIPQQLGKKAIESNVSDIAAMNGLPREVLVSLVLPPETSTEFVNLLYEGMLESCKKYNLDLVGGNTTRGEKLVINITITGLVKKELVCYRSGAQVGDLLMVSGPLGGSAVALDLMLNHLPGNYLPHLEPRARLDFSQKYGHFFHALIDISDGLASEIRHICTESKVGAVIEKEKIPLSAEVRRAGQLLKKDPSEYALNGGEDYELLFTIAPQDAPKVPGIIIGKIVEEKEGMMLQERDKKIILSGGYDHFSS